MSSYVGVPAADYLQRAGKGLRPALCLATCTAFGGDVEDALPSAAAIELLHTAFLVHDDVEDDSELRRGGPTLHRQYGRALAMNAGDGLAVLALGALRDNQCRLGRRLAARIWSEFDLMARQTVDGQARELGWQREGRTDLTPDDYLDMIIQKTCWYTTLLPLRVGALIGARKRVDLEPMLRFGFFLGAAFQIRDDILNLVGTRGGLRQGAARRPPGGQADPHAHPPHGRHGADGPRPRRSVPRPPAAERSTDHISEVLAMMQTTGASRSRRSSPGASPGPPPWPSTTRSVTCRTRRPVASCVTSSPSWWNASAEKSGVRPPQVVRLRDAAEPQSLPGAHP